MFGRLGENLRLTGKVNAIMLLCLLLLLVLLGTVSTLRERQVLTRLLTERGDALVNSIAVSAIEPMLIEDYPVLETLLEVIGRENRDVFELLITNKTGEVAKFTRKNRADDDIVKFAAEISFLADTLEPQVNLGQVHLILSDRNNQEIILGRITEMILFTLVAFICIFIVLSRVVREMVLNRILAINDHTVRIGRGEMDEELVAKSGDELGDLAAAINDMAGKIKQSQDEVLDKNLIVEQERERLNLIIEGTRAGLWDWEVQTGKTVFNERWAEIAGYTLDELAPVSIQTWIDLCHPQDMELSNKLLKRHFDGELPYYDCECRMRHKDGSWVWVRDRGKVVEWSEEGQPLRLAGTHTDITARKHAQNQLLRANEQLEMRVEERTRKIEEIHSRLVMQEKMASIGLLAAGLAHELNNPINFVRMNFATLEDNFQDLLELIAAYRELSAGDKDMESGSGIEGIRELEEQINLPFLLEDIPVLLDESDQGFNRISTIIQSMRDFSRETPRGNPEWVNINTNLENTLTIARNSYKYHADIVADFGDIPDVRCYPEQLNQVFLNIIVNSAQAVASMGRQEKGVITVRTRQNGDEVFCTIQDDGPGVPEENRNRLFEPFFTTKPPGQGTGLGLSISYDIVVQKHKGRLLVDCPEQGGTVFTIVLPVGKAEEGHEKE